MDEKERPNLPEIGGKADELTSPDLKRLRNELAQLEATSMSWISKRIEVSSVKKEINMEIAKIKRERDGN